MLLSDQEASNEIFIICLSIGTRTSSSTFRKEVGIGSRLQGVVLDSMVIFLTSSSGLGVRDPTKGVAGAAPCIAVDSVSFSSSCMRGSSITSSGVDSSP